MQDSDEDSSLSLSPRSQPPLQARVPSLNLQGVNRTGSPPVVPSLNLSSLPGSQLGPRNNSEVLAVF